MNTVSTSTVDARSRKLLYVFEQGPFSTSSGLETLEAVLSGANFEQDLSLLFIHNGVFQLKKNQETKDSLIKPYTKTFLALEDFGISKIYVHDLSMLARGLQGGDLMLSAQFLSSEQVANLIAGQHRVFTF